jgi:hypothetical protein
VLGEEERRAGVQLSGVLEIVLGDLQRRHVDAAAVVHPEVDRPESGCDLVDGGEAGGDAEDASVACRSVTSSFRCLRFFCS